MTTTLALSSFFRLSLNKGRDWVTVAEEKAHVENYLAIQKMRYGAILEYDIDFTPEILEESMLKLLLQPLVENAIYHGIKQTRRRGHIALKGYRDGDRMIFTVSDNGNGMTSGELAKLRESLSRYDVSSPGTGFGLGFGKRTIEGRVVERQNANITTNERDFFFRRIREPRRQIEREHSFHSRAIPVREFTIATTEVKNPLVG